LDRRVGPEVGHVEQERGTLEARHDDAAAAVNSGALSTITASFRPAPREKGTAESANDVWLSSRRATPRLGAVEAAVRTTRKSPRGSTWNRRPR
jgi:hypothetical protein